MFFSWLLIDFIFNSSLFFIFFFVVDQIPQSERLIRKREKILNQKFYFLKEKRRFYYFFFLNKKEEEDSVDDEAPMIRNCYGFGRTWWHIWLLFDYLNIGRHFFFTFINIILGEFFFYILQYNVKSVQHLPHFMCLQSMFTL